MSKDHAPKKDHPAVPDELPPSPADASSTRAPKHETPKVADGADLPRVVEPIERAPAGCKRYKVRADNVSSASAALYVLAKAGDLDGVKKCYSAHCPEHAKEHEKQLKAWERAGKPGLAPEGPELVVVELPD